MRIAWQEPKIFIEDDTAKSSHLQPLKRCFYLLCSMRHVRDIASAFVLDQGNKVGDNPQKRLQCTAVGKFILKSTQVLILSPSATCIDV